ncbi:glycosyltransferase involved in cell wall biosynthesis [Deinobacterium chartae]|uniref:Glycosyltransferase involved in cell wall biosynthesis n=1 Tax=Deinobacterium chartae TaxID=521158 RepID=A0A841I083_9DEIO|nr:glycosyltransferase involved in cell wall biosynthesis [Deinobacterium chartae]
MTPRVSIGLPVYNAAPFLALALASVLAQTETRWELIVVDDGSQDDSLNLVRSFSDPRIRVVSDGQNRGLAARLNQIATLAQAPLLARMDADDLMHPERLAYQLAFLDAHPEVDVVGSAVYAIDVQGRPYGYRSTTPPHSAAQALGGSPFIHPTVTGRSEWFRRFPYDEAHDRAEDFELWTRSLPHSRFAVLERPLLFYRELGLPYLRKYLRSSQGVRRVLHQRGPAQLGQLGTLRALLTSYAKDGVYRVMSALGRESELLLRRNRPLSVQEQAEALETLRHIRTFLPQAAWTPLEVGT